VSEEQTPKTGKPWKDDSYHCDYESADALRNKMLRIWKDDENHKGMQVKIHFLPSRNKFVVKTRLHPDFEPVKNKKKKNAKNRKKNKRNNEGGKYDPQAST
jgi:hypothetical protein